MIILIFLLNCKTFVIDLKSPKDYDTEYRSCKNDQDLHRVNVNVILDLKKTIYNLWSKLIAYDKKNITINDLRSEKSIDEYEGFINKDAP
jgi:hypothetical protein